VGADMDTLRGFGEDDAIDRVSDEEDHGVDSPASVDTDERRMHVRAYNHWVSLLGGRDFPSIEDLEPHNLDDFGPHSVLLDFSAGIENPAVGYLGARLRQECGLDSTIAMITDIPGRSLLSRLTDHYLQIIANRAPIGFEAEFENERGVNTLYRGILMPYSSDGDMIDFVYGVINWKELCDPDLEAELVLKVEQAIRSAGKPLEPVAAWADGPHGAPVSLPEHPADPPIAGPGEGWDEDPEIPVAADTDEEEIVIDVVPGEDAGLADWLDAARLGANAVRLADTRSRSALYRALGLAYDFALLTEKLPDDYAELLEDSGLVVQERAPMTPVVKLVFGVTYDKTRLTEFAAALSYGRRTGVAPGGLHGLLEAHEGGLKGIVKAERAARAPAPRIASSDAAEARLRQMEPRAIIEMDSGEEEFVLLVARRVSTRGLAILGAVLDGDLTDRAIRKVK